MKGILVFIACIAVCLSALADRQATYKKIYDKLQVEKKNVQSTCDTVFPYAGYSVRLIQKEDSIQHIGLDLFNTEFKELLDYETLNFIETDLLSKIALGNQEDNSIIEIKGGRITEFKKIGPETVCNISNIDSRFMIVEWSLDKGRKISINFPIDYDVIFGGTREEIENSFITRVQHSGLHRNPEADFCYTALEPYGENYYILPGPNYINKNITRNVYFYSDSIPSPIWDKSHPLESINNLMVYWIDNKSPEVELTILRHEYGEKEIIKTDVESLLAVSEKDGCLPYWGVENFDGKTLTGSLFLYNPKHGYDHVLQIICDPEEIIAGNGQMKAKASLFIPNNNIHNLIEPYRTKTEDEKINYRNN